MIKWIILYCIIGFITMILFSYYFYKDSAYGFYEDYNAKDFIDDESENIVLSILGGVVWPLALIGIAVVFAIRKGLPIIFSWLDGLFDNKEQK